MSYCPWCGAPIPDQLHQVGEGLGTLFNHTITCIRCNAVTFYQDGGMENDRTIHEMLKRKEEEE